jgi:hypothetical protein
MEDLKNEEIMEKVKEIRKENHKYHEILDKVLDKRKMKCWRKNEKSGSKITWK